jgi:hypothetical protein
MRLYGIDQSPCYHIIIHADLGAMVHIGISLQLAGWHVG